MGAHADTGDSREGNNAAASSGKRRQQKEHLGLREAARRLVGRSSSLLHKTARSSTATALRALRALLALRGVGACSSQARRAAFHECSSMSSDMTRSIFVLARYNTRAGKAEEDRLREADKVMRGDWGRAKHRHNVWGEVDISSNPTALQGRRVNE